MKLKLIWNDYLVALGLFLNLASRFITNVLTTSISGLVANANAIEANPTGIAKAASTNFYINVIEWCVLSGFIIAYYILMRRKSTKSESWMFAYQLITIIAFLFFLFDFLNDSSILLGLILHNGLKVI